MRGYLSKVWCVAILAWSAAGCGSEGGTAVIAPEIPETASPEVTGDAGGDGIADTAQDVAPEVGEEVADAPENDEADIGADGNPYGEWNKPCASNEDCQSGFCIQMGDTEWVCTITCVEECPKDWLCKGLVVGPDLNFVCVPPLGRLCQPCASDADCLYSGDLCLDVGKSGKFCLTSCADGAKCPDHYSCTSVKGPGMEEPADLCFPGTESCVCTFDLDGTSKDCSVSNDFGKCYGEQVCDGAEGWTECGAKTPAEEICDGQDQDCDGSVDEGLSPKPCIKSSEAGSCKGTETCGGPDGWLCDAAEPAVEECDGEDNDCDDNVDEEFSDLDFDGEADCVDLDDDGDGVLDGVDNCPELVNVGQGDLDEDGDGDACDDDDDGDDAPDGEDNCPGVANADQSDIDGDKQGDLCDADIDGDGALNVWDCAPEDAAIHPKAVEECDGEDNNCNMFDDEGFPDADGDKLADCSDPDDDNDGILDDGNNSGVVSDAPCADKQTVGCDDNCKDVPNQLQSDIDDDLVGDPCDNDADGDGVPDSQDCGPMDPTVHPGAKETCNAVDDNCNGQVDEGFADTDGDDLADCVDDDDDGDGDPDGADCAPEDPKVYNGAVEVCDALDSNCNGVADEGCPPTKLGLHQVFAVVAGKTAQLKVRVILGRPSVGSMASPAAGFKIRFGYYD